MCVVLHEDRVSIGSMPACCPMGMPLVVEVDGILKIGTDAKVGTPRALHRTQVRIQNDIERFR